MVKILLVCLFRNPSAFTLRLIPNTPCPSEIDRLGQASNNNTWICRDEPSNNLVSESKFCFSVVCYKPRWTIRRKDSTRVPLLGDAIDDRVPRFSACVPWPLDSVGSHVWRMLSSPLAAHGNHHKAVRQQVCVSKWQTVPDSRGK